MKRMTTALVALCAVVGLAGCSGGDDVGDEFYVDVARTGIMLSNDDLDEVSKSLCDGLEEGTPVVPAGDIDAAAQVLASLAAVDQGSADEAMALIVDSHCPDVR